MYATWQLILEGVGVKKRGPFIDKQYYIEKVS